MSSRDSSILKKIKIHIYNDKNDVSYAVADPERIWSGGKTCEWGHF
jgi:hypothetical protein